MFSAIPKVNRPVAGKINHHHHAIPKRNYETDTLMAMAGGSAAVVCSVGVWVLKNVHVASANERLVKTGLGISGMKISQTTFRFPFQIVQKIDLSPTNYLFQLKAMTNEKIEFELPGVFTIGPDYEPEACKKFAQFLSGKNKSDIGDIVKGILEGETRVLAATMGIEEIFSQRDKFKETITIKIEEELQKFGLRIWNANIQELSDTQGNNYFFNMKQRTLKQAEAHAAIEIAESEKKSKVGQKERETTTRQETAKFESQSVAVENETKKRIAESNAELAIINAETLRKSEFAQIEAQKIIETAKIELMEQTLRNKELSQARVNAEVSIKKSEGEKRSIEIESDAKLYAQQKVAEAKLYVQLKEAEAVKIAADAQLYAQQCQADGIKAIKEAEAQGFHAVLTALGGNPNVLLRIKGMESGLYEKLANSSASAVKGMQPKVTIWNTGTADGGDAIASTLKNIVSNVPPMLDAVQDYVDVPFLKKKMEEKKQE